MKQAKFVIENTLGIHARPAAEIVKLATKFESEINLSGNSKDANAKRLLGVMAMGIKQGQELVITASGSDETEVLEAFELLISKNFHEK